MQLLHATMYRKWRLERNQIFILLRSILRAINNDGPGPGCCWGYQGPRAAALTACRMGLHLMAPRGGVAEKRAGRA